MRLFYSICFCLLAGIFTSCQKLSDRTSFPEEKFSKTFTLASWNVQTFFDGEKNGCEYSDFQKSGNWNREKYQVRLQRLCEVIKELNPDIFVLIEVENQSVVQDISNFLSGNSWRGKNLWQYSCFEKPANTAIGIAVISKYPLYNFTTHNLDIRTQIENQPSSRYLLEVSADIDGAPVTLFANHWKSMSGGEEESEIWRDWQESLLAGRLLENQKSSSCAVICGDFNRDVETFVSYTEKNANGSKNLLLRNAGLNGLSTVAVYSPWLANPTTDSSRKYATEIGSYNFQNKWSRIDNIMLWGNGEILFFEPVARSPWANDQKIPISYKLSSNEGYSDHLPLMAKIKLK
ncbi:MAG: endonuclease/exonuclease/phosphatase family protein [Treponema sp.]|nr:endonuclease/exonuclease/phosphatase family protein [Treponema sp.]